LNKIISNEKKKEIFSEDEFDSLIDEELNRLFYNQLDPFDEEEEIEKRENRPEERKKVQKHHMKEQ